MAETITDKNSLFDGFRKRSGLVVPFCPKKIEMAIHAAVDEVARKQNMPRNEGLAPKITAQVLEQLSNPQSEFFVKKLTAFLNSFSGLFKGSSSSLER